MNENKTDIWVEKYRPTNFNDIVLSPINRKIFKNIIDMNYFPNLLFYGPPGTGKTTTIINLINEYQTRYSKINSSTIIHLNASDERGIDIIRNQINQFVKSMNLFENGLKFVILDEVDYMTKNAQQALKYILQTSIPNVRFCLICNYISKIDESLKNEFICVRFNQLPPEYICNFLRGIITKEGIYLKDVTIQSIQKMYGSDIRSMINFIQLNQNLNIEDWERNIITDDDFGRLHEVITKSKKTHNLIRVYGESLNKIIAGANNSQMVNKGWGRRGNQGFPTDDGIFWDGMEENKIITGANNSQMVNKGWGRRGNLGFPTDDGIFRSVTKENSVFDSGIGGDSVFDRDIEERGSYIHRVSVQYNIDKKTLLLKYYDWVLRNRKDELVKGDINDFFERMDNIIHNTGDVPIEILWGQV